MRLGSRLLLQRFTIADSAIASRSLALLLHRFTIALASPLHDRWLCCTQGVQEAWPATRIAQNSNQRPCFATSEQLRRADETLNYLIESLQNSYYFLQSFPILTPNVLVLSSKLHRAPSSVGSQVRTRLFLEALTLCVPPSHVSPLHLGAYVE